MKYKYGKALPVVAILILLISAIIQAQEQDDPLTPLGTSYDLLWWTVDGGGGTSHRDRYAVSGTAGQPDAGMMSGGTFIVSGGFWGTEGALQGIRYPVYLPVVLNNSAGFSYFEDPLESEDNDSYSQANGVLYSGRDYHGYPNDAKDYFSIYLQTAGTIAVDLTNHTGNGVQLSLFYESVNDRVKYDLTSPYHIEYTGPAGWYYIYIYTASGYNSTTQYTLRATYP
ncbi:MAG: hypothetical protein JXA89_17060 [Anaerolineae bacterium]|nr:hypothetical protein [Anaerolineae bacterium]